MTLVEASFEIQRALMEIARVEGRLPRVVGVHSVAPHDCHEGIASVWLDLDDPRSNAGMGVLILHINEHDVLHMGPDQILTALFGSTTSSVH